MSVLHTESLNWEKLAINALSDPNRLQAGDDAGNKILYAHRTDAPGFGYLKVTLVNPMTPTTNSFVTILKVEGEGFICRVAYAGVYFEGETGFSFPRAIKVILNNEILIDELEERIMIYLLSRE